LWAKTSDRSSGPAREWNCAPVKTRRADGGILAAVLAVTVLLVMAAPALAAKKDAFVVGIDAYESVPRLAKAANDAAAMGDALERIGFTVLRGIDLPRREFNEAFQRFLNGIEVGDTALFFYAGHGVRIANRNYLLPRDIPAARPGQETLVTSEAIAADEILQAIQSKGARVAILILDACRDNPFAQEGTRTVGDIRGLARMATPEGSFIMYSAAAGQTALDGLGAGDGSPNSVFTRSLLPLIAQPGISLSEMARRVRRDVQDLGRTVSHDQRPAYYDEITTDFALVPGTPGTGAAAVGLMGGMTAPDDRMIELTFWNSILSSRSAASFEEYLRRYPDGEFAALARVKIDELTSASRSDEPAGGMTGMGGMAAQEKAVEIAYWNAIAESSDIAAYRSYLDKYPNGDFAALARLRIDALSAPPAPPAPVDIRPSFDCARAFKPDEIAICGSARLAALDVELTDVYKEKRASGSKSFRDSVRTTQRAWLKRRESCGADVGCLEEQYVSQIAYLRALRD